MEIKTQDNFNLNLMDFYYGLSNENNTDSFIQNQEIANFDTIIMNQNNSNKLTSTNTQSFQEFINKISSNSMIGQSLKFDELNNNSNNSKSNLLEREVKEEADEDDDDDNEDEEDDENEFEMPLVRRAISIKAKGEDNKQNKGEKKVVRFADALGLDLVSIKMIFNPDQPPYIPQSIINCFSKSNNNKNKLNKNAKPHSNNELNMLNFESNDFFNEVPIAKNPKPKSKSKSSLASNAFFISNNLFQWKNNFTQPGLAADFYIRLNSNKVLLDSFYNKGKTLNGIVRVINLFYEKHVNIRYSLDDWKSFNDLKASYMNNSCDGLTDRFSFELKIDDFLILNSIKNANNFNNQSCFNLQFAIFYSTKCPQQSNSELCFWDNNNNRNYSITCLLITKDSLNNSENTSAFD
jgi:protein phosphatase 1 regulatory subunit 3A/B/C/D/E